MAHADGVNVMSRYGHKLKAKIMQLLLESKAVGLKLNEQKIMWQQQRIQIFIIAP